MTIHFYILAAICSGLVASFAFILYKFISLRTRSAALWCLVTFACQLIETIVIRHFV